MKTKTEIRNGVPITLYLSCEKRGTWTMHKALTCESRTRRELEIFAYKEHGQRIGNFNRPYAQVEDPMCLDCPTGKEWVDKIIGTKRKKPKQPKKRVRHTGCVVEGCDKPHCSQGYCRNHYQQFWARNKANNPKAMKQ